MNTQDLLGQEQTPLVQPTSDEKTMAILSHILCIVAGLGFIPPLIIYLVKKDESKYISDHAKESLNFQLTILIIVIVLFVTIVGILLLWVVGILNIIFVILATIKASENKLYRYPLSLRLIK